jgi:twitching motility protein PilT
MAQLDRLLVHLAARGAVALRMEPNQQPMLESADGGLAPLLPTPVPSTLLEHLVKEVLPADQEAPLATRGEAAFPYFVGDQRFQVSVNRGALGFSLRAVPDASPRAALPATGDRDAFTGVIELVTDSPEHPHPEPPPPPAEAPAKAFQKRWDPLRTTPAVEETGRKESHPIIERLFQALLSHKGSDLHCSSFEVPLVRVHGDLMDLDEFTPLGPKQLLEAMESLAPPVAWKQFQEKSDADFAYSYEAGGCRLRVNFFVDRLGPGFVCRVIPNEIPDPDKLGLADPIKRLSELAKGLVLITGPTGSGKSTTLAAIIDLANRKRNDHILTIEDPIEFVHPRKKCLVNQREVGTHTESFKAGLRAALREDPDIVLVGEMRDLETIAIAIETAVTGHLVFGTLHTSSAVGTIDRVVDQFPADRQQQIRVMLADSCKAVISQILLKRVGGGRVAAIESLFITPAIANLIREGKNFQIPSAMQTGRAYGQRLMNDALLELVQANTVEPFEAYMKCPDKESFMATLKRAGINWDPRGDEKPIPL